MGILANIRVSTSTAQLWTRESAVSDFASTVEWARAHIPASEPIVTHTTIPRFQLSSMLARPLLPAAGQVLLASPAMDTSLGNHPPPSSFWLIRSSADGNSLPASTLVFSRGKWGIHRIPAAVSSPAAPVP